jgi:hypothetical protein
MIKVMALLHSKKPYLLTLGISLAAFLVGCSGKSSLSSKASLPPAPPPDFSISPNGAMLLPATDVNQLTQQQYVITNLSATASINSFTVNSSSLPASVTIQPQNCNNLAPGQSCKVQVNYTPTSTAAIPVTQIPMTATFSSASNPNPKVVHNAWVVASVGNDFLISPNPLTPFSTYLTQTGSQSFTITNISGSATMLRLAVDTSTLPASLSIQPQNCQNIAPTMSCKILVAFSPTTTTAITASLPITGTFSNGNNPNTTITHQATLSAQGTVLPASSFTMNPSSLNFDSVLIGKTVTKTFTITYSSSYQTAQSFSLPSVNGLTYDTSQCVNLSNGGSCQVSVSYSPIDNSLLPSLINVTANLTASPSTVSEPLPLVGSGIQIQTPSQYDIPFFVGWFIYEPTSYVTLATAYLTPSYSSCMSADTILNESIGNTQPPWKHGDQAIFCYEPSGANGMVLNPSPQKFTMLTNYIFSNMGSSIQPTVQNLADIFPAPTKSTLSSQPIGVTSAQFYYMMAYLFIPQTINLQGNANNFTFTYKAVDDGAIILINSNFVANLVGDNSSPIPPSLNNFLGSGSNTVMVLWVDDNCCWRSFTNPSFNFQLSAIPVFNPYVITGYCYYGLTGIGIPGCAVNYTAQGATGSQTTDANGFYTLQSLPANVPISITFSTNGQTSNAQVVTLDPHQAQTAASTINQAF